MTEAIKVIVTTMVGVREQAKVTENEIHSTIESLIIAVTGMLRDREAALISDVETVRHQKEKELQLQKDELEFLLSGIRHAVLFSEAMTTEGSDTQIVTDHQQVITRMATLTTEREKAQLEPVTDAETEFLGMEEGVELLSSVIKELGTVVSKGISVELSTIERPTTTNHSINQALSEMMSGSVKGLAVAVTDPSQVQVHYYLIKY